MSDCKQIYDLEDRTSIFAEKVIEFCQQIHRDVIANPIISQLVRAGTSVGANYCEVNGAASSRDFNNKICICKKEIREVKFWLRMVKKVDENDKDRKWLEGKSGELLLIFSKINQTMKEKHAQRI